jgi:hypothetical protein
LDAALAVALLGNLVLIVSVILLGLQVREMAKQSSHGARATLASVYQAMNDNMLQINRLFIDRPFLRPYFYGEQELTDESPEEREGSRQLPSCSSTSSTTCLPRCRYYRASLPSRGEPISVASPQAVLCFVSSGRGAGSGTRKRCERSWIP